MFALAALGHEVQDEDQDGDFWLLPLQQRLTTLSLNRPSFLWRVLCLYRCLGSLEELSHRGVKNHGLSVEFYSLIRDENALASAMPRLRLSTTLGPALVTDLSLSNFSPTKLVALLVFNSKFSVKFRLKLARAQIPNPPDPPDPHDPPRLRVIMVRSCLLPFDSDCGWGFDVWIWLVMFDTSCIGLILIDSGCHGSPIVPFAGDLLAVVRSLTAVCSLFPLTAICRFRSIFPLMVVALMWIFSSLWQLGKEFHNICIPLVILDCSGFHCPHISFMECFFLPNLSLVLSGIVIGSIVLEMVLLRAETKRLIVSRVDGVDCLALTTLEVLNLPLCGFDQEYQLEEVFLFVLPFSDITLVERVSSFLSLYLYLRVCCLSFTKCLSNLLVNTLACSVLCSLVVSSLSGVKLF